MTDGSWNCGLLFCRPQVVQPVTPCSVSPPANRGSVGNPVIPYSSSIVGPPTPGGSLPASVRDTPRRTSSSEDGVMVYVKPPANCSLSTCTKALLGLPVSPGIGGGSKLSTLRWLHRPNADMRVLNWWSTLMSYLSL